MRMRNPGLLVLVILVSLSIACGSSGTVVNTPTTGDANPTAVIEPTKADVPVPTNTPVPEPTAQLGLSRSNPAPAGSEVIIEGMSIRVDKLIRPATDIVMAGNMFNTEPEANQEYILVGLNIICTQSGDNKCSYSNFYVKALGSKGVERDPEWVVVGIDGLIEDAEFYGGSSIGGYLPFIVDKDETDLTLIYQTFLGDPVYLALPDPSNP